MRGSVATAPVGFFGRSGGGRWLGGLLASFVAASTLIFSGIGPASAETLKWKLGYHLTKVETSEVGNAAGHMVVLGRGSGVAFFDGGDVAAATLSITADYVNGAGPHPATASRPRDARASGDQFRAVSVSEGPVRVGRRVCCAVACRFVAIYLGPGSATSRRWKRQRESWQSWRSDWLRTASLAQRRTAPLRIQGGPSSERARRPFWRDASPRLGARCRRDQRTAAPDVALAIAFTSEASMNRRSIPDIRKSAEDSFAAGLFCAESVVSAIARARGADPAPLQKAATAFCSGVARTSSTCGALTGAIMGVSFVFGRSDPRESVQPAYSAAQRLIREFEREFGSTNCQALLGGCDLDTPEGQARFKEQRLGQRCRRFTGAAAEMAARIIAGRDN